MFEKSPCGLIGINPLRPVPETWDGDEAGGGYYSAQGNCSMPNECACWCKATYKKEICDAKGGAHFFGPSMSHRECRGPFQDILGSLPLQTFDMVNYRNLLLPHEIFGTRSCRRGFEGTVNETFDRYMTCHQRIFIPTSFEAWTLSWLIVISIVTVVVVVTYLYI